jgi:hypothetical protein
MRIAMLEVAGFLKGLVESSCSFAGLQYSRTAS